MYGKAFDNFFENTPTFSPFKEIMEPVKNAARYMQIHLPACPGSG